MRLSEFTFPYPIITTLIIFRNFKIFQNLFSHFLVLVFFLFPMYMFSLPVGDPGLNTVTSETDLLSVFNEHIVQ